MISSKISIYTYPVSPAVPYRSPQKRYRPNHAAAHCIGRGPCSQRQKRRQRFPAAAAVATSKSLLCDADADAVLLDLGKRLYLVALVVDLDAVSRNTGLLQGCRYSLGTHFRKLEVAARAARSRVGITRDAHRSLFVLLQILDQIVDLCLSFSRDRSLADLEEQEPVRVPASQQQAAVRVPEPVREQEPVRELPPEQRPCGTCPDGRSGRPWR